MKYLRGVKSSKGYSQNLVHSKLKYFLISSLEIQTAKQGSRLTPQSCKLPSYPSSGPSITEIIDVLKIDITISNLLQFVHI